MILHSLFDFALHMPANAMWFATLAGVMLHPGETEAPGAVVDVTGPGMRIESERERAGARGIEAS